MYNTPWSTHSGIVVSKGKFNVLKKQFFFRNLLQL